MREMVTKMGGPSVLNRETEYWEITSDKGTGAWHGVWENHRRAWQAAYRAPRATHHLVLEDDLVLCRDFVAGVKAAIAAQPDKFICLYSPRRIADECRETGNSWAEIVDGSWGQALILPVGYIKDMIDFDARYLRHDYMDYDGRVVMWSLANKRSWYCTMPSLVDHAGAGDSTIGYSNRGRRARWFIGAEASALDVDWSKGAESPPRQQDKHLSWKGYEWRWKEKPDGVA